MRNLTPAQTVEQHLRRYSIMIQFCLGLVTGIFVGLVVTDQGRIFAIIGLLALAVFYTLTHLTGRMLQRSVSLVAHPIETKETHV